jgi:hypothetical protein
MLDMANDMLLERRTQIAVYRTIVFNKAFAALESMAIPAC